ncbi:DUF7739 domain-containing protein [Streptomyces odontomachi]|uniref:DUF7739 domain-containing protein n=1 Tax=Streptomyces odontomachi TaxID=2944940 RepID=UPI00210DE474|nr:hypothetical protein [Streptomyces sp. ODS25]
MGWTISHLPVGQEQRSGSTITNLAQQLAHVLPGRDWAELAPVINRPFGDPFTVQPGQAGRIADLLDRAASHRLMRGDWANLARALAAAARSASSAGQAWRWS